MTPSEQDKEISEKLAEFVSNQKPLSSEFEKILNENLWDLYEGKDIAIKEQV